MCPKMHLFVGSALSYHLKNFPITPLYSPHPTFRQMSHQKFENANDMQTVITKRKHRSRNAPTPHRPLTRRIPPPNSPPVYIC